MVFRDRRRSACKRALFDGKLGRPGGSRIGFAKQTERFGDAPMQRRIGGLDRAFRSLELALRGAGKAIAVEIGFIGGIAACLTVHRHGALDQVRHHLGRYSGFAGGAFGGLGRRAAQRRDNRIIAGIDLLRAFTIQHRCRSISQKAAEVADALRGEDGSHTNQHFADRVGEHFRRLGLATRGMGIAGGHHMRFNHPERAAIGDRIAACGSRVDASFAALATFATFAALTAFATFAIHT